MKKSTIRNKIGQRIKFLRKREKITQERFALMTGVNRSYLADIENGNRNFGWDTLEHIVRGFDISFSEFFEGISFGDEELSNLIPSSVTDNKKAQ